MPRETFKAFGFEFPLTKASVWALSLIAVLGTGGFVWQKLYDDPERALLTLKEVNERQAFEIEEYGQHVMEEPTKHELFEDNDGALVLRVFRDHCVLIQRRTRGGTRTRLVPDLARTNLNLRASNRIEGPQVWNLIPVAEAAQPCNRGCLNPHPGNFQWWYGQARGEWIEVWRRWPEGCTHVQMFNPRINAWDSNPDGSPRVRWTCCTH